MIGETFLATVFRVYTESDKSLDVENDLVPIYNGNTDFGEKKDTRFLGAIEFRRESFITLQDYAFPFDKNNITYPIVGETVLVINIGNIHYWMPFSITQYPNYREDLKVSEIAREKEVLTSDTSNKNRKYNETKQTQTTGQEKSIKKSDSKVYNVKENIKFLKPKQGDTILSGRVGNTIRFSEFHLTEDGKTSSPSIFIRNKQNPELDSSPIGTLIEEDINKDGTSIYITSNKVKIPFKETIKKSKIGFTQYPNSEKLTGNQLFVNSDRIVLSAKASEFIIFGKGNTGVITDGNYSIDAEKDVYVNSNKNITIHSNGANQIFLNSENGKVYLGKNTGEGGSGADVQKMVLGGELIKILGELIDAINKQQYLTPAGPSKLGPENIASFNSIKNNLNNLLSANNFLSK